MTGKRRSPSAAEVRLRQEAYYGGAEVNRFEWLTQHPYVQRLEERILQDIGAEGSFESILDVGCGEGAGLSTLRRLGSGVTYTGFDCLPEKIRFCYAQHRDGWFLVADARQVFPFRSEVYSDVLVRDVLHHLEEGERKALLREALRVLRPGGILWIVEGNANNPIAFVFALLFKHERCMLETRSHLLTQFVERMVPQNKVAVRMEEPSTLFRLLFHYRFGFPGIGRCESVIRLVDGWGGLMRQLLPRRFWAYSILTVSKNPEP
jgi:SAM-dependent methyltransferase